MPYVEAAGAKLYFEESGHGYPIIFIHEFASDIRGWEAQVRYFSRSYRCIAYNARGYPPSDVPEDASLYRWQFAVGRHRRCHAGSKDRTRPFSRLEHGRICCLAVWVALSGKNQCDGRSKRRVWLSSLPPRRLVEGNVSSRADLYRARNGLDVRANGTWSGSHPTQVQGPEELARIRSPPASTFGTGNVEHDGTLPGLAAIIA